MSNWNDSIMRYVEKNNLQLPPKCTSCGDNFLPNAITDTEHVSGIEMLCGECGYKSLVYIKKDPKFRVDDIFKINDALKKIGTSNENKYN